MRPWTGSLRACRAVASRRLTCHGRVQQRAYARQNPDAREPAGEPRPGAPKTSQPNIEPGGPGAKSEADASRLGHSAPAGNASTDTPQEGNLSPWHPYSSEREMKQAVLEETVRAFVAAADQGREAAESDAAGEREGEAAAAAANTTTARGPGQNRPSSANSGSSDGGKPGRNVRMYSTSAVRKPTPKPARKTPEDTDAQDEAANDLVDWENAFRVDSGTKTVETEAGKLPLSPVMDPQFWDRRSLHKRPKARPTVGALQNSVERQVSRSPYARALATPLRYDAVTRNRMPKFFLDEFKLMAHPEDGKPWWVPHSLLSAGAAASAPAGEGAEKAGRPLGPSGYSLARYEILKGFTGRKAVGIGEMYRKLLGPSSSPYKHKSATAGWRPDMHDLVLGLMRRHVVDDLLYLARLCAEDRRHYITRCFGWGDVKFKHKGSVLWFAEPAEDGRAAAAAEPPGHLATIDVGDDVAMTTIAVHNMALLLGDELAARLRSEAAVLAEGGIFMLAGRRTVEAQMKLWKLQCFLADYQSLQ